VTASAAENLRETLTVAVRQAEIIDRDANDQLATHVLVNVRVALASVETFIVASGGET
jgi:hypothetical protein